MSTALFGAKPGTLIEMKSDFNGAALITLSGLFPSTILIGTSFHQDRTQDTDTQKSLTGIIYAYAFGEAVGKISVGGMLFFYNCVGKEAPIKELNDYYNKNNIYTKTDPVIIGIGSAALPGYLETMSISVENADFNYGGFNLTFLTIPKREMSGSSSGGGKGASGSIPLRSDGGSITTPALSTSSSTTPLTQSAGSDPFLNKAWAENGINTSPSEGKNFNNYS